MANQPVNSGSPPSVRLIRRGADAIRRHRGLSLAVAALTAALVSAAAGVYAVPVEESAAVLRLGRLADAGVLSGLHVRLPWGIDRVLKVQTGGVHRLEVSADTEKTLSLVTADENLIEMLAVIQYKITGVAEYLLRVESPDALIIQAVRSAITEVVAGMPVDDVLTVGKAKIQNDARTHAQTMLDRYGSGLTLVAVNLQSAAPPEEAAASFRNVNDAKAEAARSINNAEREKERSVNLAGGEAGKKIAETAASAEARRRQAEGASARFRQVLAQERQTPGLTRTDLHSDVIKKVLGRAKIVVLPPGQAPRIEMNWAEKAPSAKPPAAPTPAQGQAFTLPAPTAPAPAKPE